MDANNKSRRADYLKEWNKNKQATDILYKLIKLERTRIYKYLKNIEVKKNSIDYLGCRIDEMKAHIEKQFKDKMNKENYGKWHIDNIIPLKYNNPTLEEVIERLHYTNTQPMWALENLSKGYRYVGKYIEEQNESL